MGPNKWGQVTHFASALSLFHVSQRKKSDLSPLFTLSL